MKPLEQYVTHYDQIMITLLRLGPSGYDKKNHGFGSSIANISCKIPLFYRVHGRAWLLIAYII